MKFSGFTDFCVKNVKIHGLGRREIELAEQEMPALLTLRSKVIALADDITASLTQPFTFPHTCFLVKSYFTVLRPK